MTDPKPTLLPLGDRTLLLRFAETLNEGANRAAIFTAQSIAARNIVGVTEIVPNLVSVSIHYDPWATSFTDLAGQIRLCMNARDHVNLDVAHHTIPVRFGGDNGPDLREVARALNMTETQFISAHNARSLRVLATGFAPGFVYCGMHPKQLSLPRRNTVRSGVPSGTILFAAGQTAITATTIPTGWHVIGRTDFSNFDVKRQPPNTLTAGDEISFAWAS